MRKIPNQVSDAIKATQKFSMGLRRGKPLTYDEKDGILTVYDERGWAWERKAPMPGDLDYRRMSELYLGYDISPSRESRMARAMYSNFRTEDVLC